jgi:hypothetical protein
VVNDVAALLTAVGALITAASAGFALVWNTVRNSREERDTSAKRAVVRLLQAAEDGTITPDELAEARKEFEDGGDDA